jgi:hypothetical protein
VTRAVSPARGSAVIEALLERRWAWCLSAVLVAVAGLAARQAWSRPLWHDEIYTMLFARLPSVPAIWRAAHLGADLVPPLNAVLTHAVLALPGPERMAGRLPALVAFLVAAGLGADIVRARAGASAGLASALMLWCSTAFTYAYEARGYALLLALAALSVWSWLRAARGVGRGWALPVLAVSLGACLWTHYYGVLILMPILVGELIRLWGRRRLDWGIAAAVVGGLAAAAPLVPLVRIASSHGPSFWQHTSFLALPGIYRFILGFLLSGRLLLLSGVVAVMVVARQGTRGPQLAMPVPAHEIGAGLAACLIPLAGIVAALATTGVLVPRYVLTGILGVVTVVPIAVRRMAVNTLPVQVLAGGLALAFGLAAADAATASRRLNASALADRPALMAALRGGNDVLVAVSGRTYLEAWYASGPEMRQRMVYLADPAAALALDGTSTIDEGYLALRAIAPLSVEPYGAFVAGHGEFLLYAGEGAEWVVQQLRRDAATLLPVGQDGASTLYRVIVAGRIRTPVKGV